MKSRSADLSALDATAQAELVCQRSVSARELVQSAIDRIEQLDGTLNAVVHTRFERALEECDAMDPARQPFAGVPILLKDAGVPQRGEPHHQGMAVLRTYDHREREDGWLVERLRAVGFVVVGRTNTPELCSLPTTEPVACGATRNPWSLAHSTGGSSGGSAAAVAAGLVPLAHASDGGGSIRMPASCCGLVGLKPANGRLTRGPQEGESWGGLSVDGFVTRSVRDAAAVLDLVAGPGAGDPQLAPPWPGRLTDAVAPPHARAPLRIGVRTDAYGDGDPTHADCLAAVALARASLSDLGHDVRDGGPPELDDPELPPAQGLVVAVSMAASVALFAERIGRAIEPDALEPFNADMVRAGLAADAVSYARARERLHAYTRRIVPWWDSHDLLLTPTLTHPPPRLGEIRGDLDAEAGLALRRRYGWLTPPWNITGQPAISLPVHTGEEGLPIGVQLVAAPGREDVLLSVGAQLEAALGGFTPLPVHA